MNFLTNLFKDKEFTIIKQTNPDAIKNAVNILEEGGIIIYPTETSYGIGADATNRSAVREIYRIKDRDVKKNLSVLMSDIKMVKENIDVSNDAENVIKDLMPGPLTLICKKNQESKIVCNDESIAFRISSNKFATKLVSKFGKPITATSANLSNTPALYKKSDVLAYFVDKIDIFIDAGDLEETRPSTLFDMGTKKIIRKGSISKYDIMNSILGKFNHVNK